MGERPAVERGWRPGNGPLTGVGRGSSEGISGMDDKESSVRARRLAAAIEPFAGQVYFSPECHQLYADLGFAGSSATINGVAMPDGPAYFCSRGSILGQIPGELIASAFAVFNPAVVVPAVSDGWGDHRCGEDRTSEDRRSCRPTDQDSRIVPTGCRTSSGHPGASQRLPARSPGSHCTPGSWPFRCRHRLSAPPGATPTGCANSAVTPTPRPGPRPALMR